MAVRRIFMPALKRHSFGDQMQMKDLSLIYKMSMRNLFRSTLMKGVEIVSKDELELRPRAGKKLPLIETKKTRPLLLLFPWMGCTPKQSDRFINIYLNKGFDVLLVSCFTFETIWYQGVEKKAEILLDFLRHNELYQPIVYHGFSVGNGLFTSMIWKMSQNVEEHGPTAERIKGQIYDSPPQTSNVVRNVCYGAFPSSKKMGQLLYNVVRVILDVTKTDILTDIYDRNTAIYYNQPFKIPLLLFCSHGDMYSELEGNMTALEHWKKNGLQSYIKCWEKSKHVGHFFLHKEEYLETLNFFLRTIGVENQELEEVIAPYEIPQIQKIQIPNIR